MKDSIYKTAGILCIVVGVIIIFVTFYPVINEEVRYSKHNLQTNINNQTFVTSTPVNTEFSIQIPKINANAKVIENVDPYNEKEYQKKLTLGVAHAKGSTLPDQQGNMFLFAHSSQDFFIASRYNAVFYLLNKLQEGDKLQVMYKGEPYAYTVFNKEIVSASDVSYMKSDGDEKTITLMTCWPPGTSFKRLLIQARQD